MGDHCNLQRCRIYLVPNDNTAQVSQNTLTAQGFSKNIKCLGTYVGNNAIVIL